MENLPSYARDTKHILNIINDIEWEEGIMLVTLDVTSLYTFITHENGLLALRTFVYKRPAELIKHTHMVVDMARLIMDINVFLFNGKWYQQLCGVAMGYRFASSYGNLFIGWFEAVHVWGPASVEWTDFILYWGYFIDDILMIWMGSEDAL